MNWSSFRLLLVPALACVVVSASAQTPQPVSAQPAPIVDLAYGAFQRSEYKTAFKEASIRLEQNKKDAAAMTLLAGLYAQGLGVPPDLKLAAQWYTAAAQNGDIHAMSAIGMMALEGQGIEKNIPLGREWLEKAAAQNEPVASFNLALLLFASGTVSDEKKAVELLKIAAEAEVPDAQHALGVAYLKGRGIDRNAEEAAKWFFRAAENGSIAGEVEYAILVFNGAGGVAKNETVAAKLFLRAAYKGNAVAQNRISRLYLTGRGVPLNKVEAAAWHQAASVQGLPDPMLEDGLKDLTGDQRAAAERLFKERTTQ